MFCCLSSATVRPGWKWNGPEDRRFRILQLFSLNLVQWFSLFTNGIKLYPPQDYHSPWKMDTWKNTSLLYTFVGPGRFFQRRTISCKEGTTQWQKIASSTCWNYQRLKAIFNMPGYDVSVVMRWSGQTADHPVFWKTVAGAVHSTQEYEAKIKN